MCFDFSVLASRTHTLSWDLIRRGDDRKSLMRWTRYKACCESDALFRHERRLESSFHGGFWVSMNVVAQT